MSFYYHSEYNGNGGSLQDKFGDINNISIDDIFDDEDLLEDINENNYDLVEALSLPNIAEDIKNIILNPPESDDDYKKYKVPYLAASCFSVIPEERMKEIVNDGTFFDNIFNIIFDDSTSDMRLGLFTHIFLGLVQKVPSQLYNYLIEHEESISTRLVEHMKDHSIVEIARYLLDFPYSQPWWSDSKSFVHLFLSSLANPECSSGITLFFISIICRATYCYNDCPYRLSLILLPHLVDDSFLGGLFDIIMKEKDEDVIYNALSIYSRLLWIDMYCIDYGLGGYYSAIDNKYYGETTQTEGIVDETSRSFVLKFLEGKLTAINNKLNELMEEEDVDISSFDKNVKMKRCPKSILGIVEFYQFYYKANNSGDVDNGILDIINTLIVAGKHYSYNSYLHHSIVETLTTLMNNKQSLQKLVNDISFLQFLSQEYDSSNLCLRNLSHLLLSSFLTQCNAHSLRFETDTTLWDHLHSLQETAPPQQLGKDMLRHSEYVSSGSMVRELIENAALMLEKLKEEEDKPCDLDEFDVSTLPSGSNQTMNFPLPDILVDSLPVEPVDGDDLDDDLDLTAISNHDLDEGDDDDDLVLTAISNSNLDDECGDLNDSFPLLTESSKDDLPSIPSTDSSELPDIPAIPSILPCEPEEVESVGDIRFGNSLSMSCPVDLPIPLSSSPPPEEAPSSLMMSLSEIHIPAEVGDVPENGVISSDVHPPPVYPKESPAPVPSSLPPPPPFPLSINSHPKTKVLSYSLNSVNDSQSSKVVLNQLMQREDSIQSINSDDINSLPFSCVLQEDMTQEDFPNLNNLPQDL